MRTLYPYKIENQTKFLKDKLIGLFQRDKIFQIVALTELKDSNIVQKPGFSGAC
jgi:hypothetical protein